MFHRSKLNLDDGSLQNNGGIMRRLLTDVTLYQNPLQIPDFSQ